MQWLPSLGIMYIMNYLEILLFVFSLSLLGKLVYAE